MNKKLAKDIFNYDITFEKTFPLIGDLKNVWDMDSLTKMHGEEILKAMDISEDNFRLETPFDLEEITQYYNKHGLLAEINVRCYEWNTKHSASSKPGNRVYIIYGDTYKELINEAIKTAKQQRNEEKERDLSKKELETT